jgi:hypothetical protein
VFFEYKRVPLDFVYGLQGLVSGIFGFHGGLSQGVVFYEFFDAFVAILAVLIE